jgi:hypothetical protein
MKEAPQFDLIRFLREARRRGIRCLLIGRWAVAQHGAPVVTADYDFWVNPKDRARLYRLLGDLFDAELPPEDQRKRPIVTAFIGADKVDIFSPRKIVNEEGRDLVFDAVYARSVEKRDPEGDLVIRVPSIEDLIAMKKVAQRDPMKRARDLEDIRYLLTLKRERKRGKR